MAAAPPEPFYEDLGRRIANARTARGMTQETLGRKLSMTRASIANIENGKQRMLVHTFVLIAETFGLGLDALAGREPKAPESTDEVTAELREKLPADADFGAIEHEIVRGARRRRSRAAR